MGQCVSTKKKFVGSNLPSQLPYPKFKYFNPQAQLTIKFITPSQILPTKIPSAKFRLPINGLSTKLPGNQYFLLGGFDLLLQKMIKRCYLIDFNKYEVIDRAPLPFQPIGGSLYYYRDRIYLVGACKKRTSKILPQKTLENELYTSEQPQKLFDIGQEQNSNQDLIPFPFKQELDNQIANQKIIDLSPSKIMQYHTVHNKWVKVTISHYIQLNQHSIAPDKLLDCGTALLNGKIYFIGGYYFQKNNLIPNQDIIFFDLLTRNISLCSVQFPHLLLIPKCVGVNRNTILIIGGYTQQRTPNQIIYQYNIDKNIKTVGVFKNSQKLTDGYTPIGKSGFAVVFGYPYCYLLKPDSSRNEEHLISVTI